MTKAATIFPVGQPYFIQAACPACRHTTKAIARRDAEDDISISVVGERCGCDPRDVESILAFRAKAFR